MSSRAVRLIVIPAILFVVVSAAVFAFAKWHPAKRESATPTVVNPSGPKDPVRGASLFAENCATCHGERGTGGGVGPMLVGSELSLAEARAIIVSGRGVMPAGLVSGQDLEDVLAYLQLVFAQ